jgi:hypothetical protein
MKINYKISLTNGDYVFRRHFSADLFGILETSITMFIIYTLFIVFGIGYGKLLYNKKFFHNTFKLFLISVIFEWISFLFYMSEYGQFSVSGKFTPGMLTCGNFC